MLITSSKKIKKALLKRWEEIDLIQIPKADGERYRGFNAIINDVADRAPEMKITQDRLSKYIHEYKGEDNWLTENQVLWLCFRYGIPVAVDIGDPIIVEGNIISVIPPYNESDCLKKLKRFEKILTKKK